MASKKQLLYRMLLFHIVFILGSVVATPRLNVTLTQIIPGLSESLDLNCSFALDDTSNMAAFISLIVSRTWGPEHNITELATVSDFTDACVNTLTSENVSATGVFTAVGESHINLHWDYPTQRQAGIYRCSAQGFDVVGRFIAIPSYVSVRVHELSFDDWTAKVKEMDAHVKSLEKKLSEANMDRDSVKEDLGKLSANIQTLEQSLEQMGIHLRQKDSDLELYTQRLEQRISSIEKDKLNNIALMFEAPQTYNNHKYYVSKGGFLRIDIAYTICNVFGGYLVEINDAEEYNAIRSFLESYTGIYGVVISGTDEGHEGTWVLPSTNQALPYTDWYIGNPNGGKIENCLSLWAYNTWQMMDWACYRENPSASYRFMCEMPQG